MIQRIEESGRRAAVPDGRSGAVEMGWRAGVSGEDGSAGKDTRLPDRAGEIEAVLQEHRGVKEAVVVAQGGDKRRQAAGGVCGVVGKRERKSKRE